MAAVPDEDRVGAAAGAPAWPAPFLIRRAPPGRLLQIRLWLPAPQTVVVVPPLPPLLPALLQVVDLPFPLEQQILLFCHRFSKNNQLPLQLLRALPPVEQVRTFVDFYP